jgi:hypothetical protein
MSSKPVSEAQSKPTKRQCPSCGERVVITASNNWRCPECTTGFCPFCKTSVLDRCQHVVASWTDDGGWNFSPFENAPLPEVPEELHDLEPTEKDWRDVFGKEAAEVVSQAYTDGGALSERQQGDEERELFLLMVERRRLECDSSSWEVGHWFTSSHGTDYFSLKRERIFAGLKEEVAWLAAGLERLFAIARERRWVQGEQHLFNRPETPYRVRREGRLICRWFVDNPVGSTTCYLSLLGVANARTFGLYFEVHHSEFPESLLFAELPREVATDPAQLFQVLQALFARNGAEDHGHYLLRCPPHRVKVGGVLDASDVKTLFTRSREVAGYVADVEKWWLSVVVAGTD